MRKKEQIRKYSSFDTDFSKTRDQNFKVPENYKWTCDSALDKVLSAVLYSFALFFSFFYLRFFLRIRIKGREKLRGMSGKGIFLYANHTQPIGDVFLPAHVCFPKRIYTIASPANLAIPLIGKVLPYLGALPLPSSLEGMRKLSQTVKTHISNGKCVVIYPEAHVWEYCTDIRPFDSSSFSLPARLDAPVYCLTLTYKKSGFRSRPAVTAFVDGPFYSCEESAVQKREELFRKVRECMIKRSRESEYRYIKYEKEE